MVTLKFPHKIFLEFSIQAYYKAIQNKEIVTCAKVALSHSGHSYVISTLLDTQAIEESLFGVKYYCLEKEAVIHTHVNLQAIPSGIDRNNMLRDNKIIPIGKLIRPPNPVFYSIGSISLFDNRFSLELRGYYPVNEISGVRVEKSDKKVFLSDEAYEKITSLLSRIEYGVVTYEDDQNKIYVKNAYTLSEYAKMQLPQSVNLAYFVTGVSEDIGEPQDPMMMYFITATENKKESLLLKMSNKIGVYNVYKEKDDVKIDTRIGEAKVIISD